MTKSKAAVTINYTEGELAAIAALMANAKGEDNAKSAKDLGISTGTLTSLVKKANDERPMADGVERIIVNKKDYESKCPVCGTTIAHKLYWVD